MWELGLFFMFCGFGAAALIVAAAYADSIAPRPPCNKTSIKEH